MNMNIRRTRRETQLAPISRQIFDPNQINLHTIMDGMVKKPSHANVLLRFFLNI
jgi:hypothetical protein